MPKGEQVVEEELAHISVWPPSRPEKPEEAHAVRITPVVPSTQLTTSQRFLICTKFERHDTMLCSLLAKRSLLLDPARTGCGAKRKGIREDFGEPLTA